jgi:hypothetical protein
MNYYQARERRDHSGWHFTVRNNDHIYPVGYCACHAAHSTKKEAEECYAKFLLDTRLRLQEERPIKSGDTVLGCKECGNLTALGAAIDMQFIPLCVQHRTREFVEKHWRAPTEVWGSW